MSIYVLIILCGWAILSLIAMLQGYLEKEPKTFIASTISLLLTVLAIIFQSINL